MNLTVWVDVSIGLTLIYLGASLLVTIINEYVAQILNLRGKQLCKSLTSLMNLPEVANILKQSPVLKPFFDSRPDKAPSYIDPNVLAHLLVGGLADPGAAGDTVKQVAATIDKLPDSDLKSQLQALVRTAGNTTEELVGAVSEWAERTLNVLGEGYKRNMQKISFCIGLTVAVAFNLDTVTLTQHLYQDKDARSAAVELGVQIAQQNGNGVFDKCIKLSPQERSKDASCAPLLGLVDTIQARNENLGKLPIGWPLPRVQDVSCFWLWLTHIAGWLLTALAISLGAPFWFDLLNKLVNMRSGMRKPEGKKKN